MANVLADGMDTAQALRDAYDLGGAQGHPREVEGHYYRLVPDGWVVENMDEAIERLRETPNRKQGSVRLTNPDSFVAYVNRHADSGATVYIDSDAATFRAVLNDHAEEAPGWADHEAMFSLKATRAWKAWQSLSAQMVGQDAFADFLEDRITEIAEPDGAQLFDLITDLHVNTNVSFRSAVERTSGRVKLTYQEEGDQGGGKAGDIRVPDTITVQVAPYEGLEAVTVKGRFRFRVLAGGKASFGYDLDEEIARVREEAVAQTTTHLVAGIPGVLFVYGSRG